MAGSERDPATITRCGAVAIVGKPNVGKSTLLNALVGEPIAIVSAKPQATRQPVIGIRSDADSQILFHDEPGLLDPQYLMHRAMLEAAVESVVAADAVLYLVPLGAPVTPLVDMEPRFADLDLPIATVFTKADTRSGTPGAGVAPAFVVSARNGAGLESVITWCKAQVPIGPFRHDVDDFSTQPTRFFVTEFVREAAFEILSDELPYAVAAEVDEFREGSKPLYIRVTLFVERDSQKKMVVGSGGQTIRRLGSRARSRIEALLGEKVFLDLWVKTLPKWRTKASVLHRFGLPLITEKRP